jgi:CheY-like chemotaxis protein
MAHPVRVLVVDDQPMVRRVTRSLLEATAGFEAVGEAASGVEALSAIERLEPDLVLLDLRMPGMDGIETAQRIRARGGKTVVVLMSGDACPPTPEPTAVACVAKEGLRVALLRELWAQYAPSR